MLECVINVSEGRRAEVIARVAGAAGDHLLDVHGDADHHRSVITIAGPDVEDRAFAVARAAVDLLDMREHAGVHPRLGVADVIPFVPLGHASIDDAVAARNRTAARIARDLGVPCFLYGPERSLPHVRQHAFASLAPDEGPTEPHPTAGASCVGARDVLVAYNVWLEPSVDEPTAKRIAAALRSPAMRTLALCVGEAMQVSCNLLDPAAVGPAFAYDAVARDAPVARAELVGLIPRAVLHAIDEARWQQLDLDPAKTIEARLEEAGLDGEVGTPKRDRSW